MPRPRKYDDRSILDAATEAFLELGAAAPTSLIARRAGVSEGILFKRFGTKEALFEAALTRDTESEHWRRKLLGGIGKGTPRDNLKKAILALFDKLHRIIPKRMILEGQGCHRPFPSGKKAPPVADAEAICAYLEGEIRLGRIKLEVPELHAHEIVGAVLHGTMLELRHGKTSHSPKQWADHLVKVHLPASPGKRIPTPER